MSNHNPRIFKTGAVRIVEDESMHGLDNEAIRSLLKATYPEIAAVTVLLLVEIIAPRVAS